MKLSMFRLIMSLWKESSPSLRKISCHFSKNHLMPIATIDGEKNDTAISTPPF
jgi:hypothetical protein